MQPVPGSGNVSAAKVVWRPIRIGLIEIMESYNAWPCVPTDGFETMMIQCYQKQIVIFLRFVLKV